MPSAAEVSPTPLRRASFFTSIGAVLDKTVKDLGLAGALEKGAALVLWPEVVGEAVSRVTHPQTVRGRTLVVAVADSAWLQQLRYMEETMVERLNAAVGRTVIEGIYLQVGTVPSAPVAEETPEPPGGLDAEEAADLEDAVAGLEDQDLRATIRRVLAASRRIEEGELP
jgi:predicted nucleic acid-binding Zn ribbon protein